MQITIASCFLSKQTTHSLQNDLDRQAVQYKQMLDKNAKFRQRLNEALPMDDGQLKDASLMMINGLGSSLAHADSRLFVGDEDMDGTILQVEKLKSYINKLELQIYEMNEKVSELIENVSKGAGDCNSHLWVPNPWSLITDTANGAWEQDVEGGKRKHEQRGQDGNAEYEREHRDQQTVSSLTWSSYSWPRNI